MEDELNAVEKVDELAREAERRKILAMPKEKGANDTIGFWKRF